MTAIVCTVMSALHHSWAGLGAEQRYWESEEGSASKLAELAEVADQPEGGAQGGPVCAQPVLRNH